LTSQILQYELFKQSPKRETVEIRQKKNRLLSEESGILKTKPIIINQPYCHLKN